MRDREKIIELFEKNKSEINERINSGIEQYRKGAMTVEIKDKDGNPVKNAKIKINQTSHEFKYGANLFMLDELESDSKNEKYKEFFKDAFNMATIPFYWDDLEPERGRPRYAKESKKIYRRPAPDLCIEFCEENGIEPREHALAYDAFFPKWLYDADVYTVKREYERRCREISERYGDKINTIEVTNETWWSGGKTALYNEPDFIEWCFKTASKYFVSNKLAINEWSGVWEEPGRTRDRYYLQIERALEKGTSIDAIGIQYHMFFKVEDEYRSTRQFYNPEHLYKILDNYARFNKPMQITEVTIPAYTENEEDELLQAELIDYLYSIWFSHKNIEQIIYWNLVDGYAAFAPQGDMTAGENYYRGGFIRFDFTPKPAYFKIKELFEKRWHTELETVSDDKGRAGFRGFYGDYDVTIEVGGGVYEKKIKLMRGRKDASIVL